LRQNILTAAAQRELEGLMEVAPADAGMHLVGWLPKNVNDKAASEKAHATAWRLRPYLRTVRMCCHAAGWFSVTRE
jgi:GntR family transcriptional regulator/MocR family aminotransferase